MSTYARETGLLSSYLSVPLFESSQPTIGLVMVCAVLKASICGDSTVSESLCSAELIQLESRTEHEPIRDWLLLTHLDNCSQGENFRCCGLLSIRWCDVIKIR